MVRNLNNRTTHPFQDINRDRNTIDGIKYNTTQAKRHLSHLMAKPNKWYARSAKTQTSPGIRPVWSESSLCARWATWGPKISLCGQRILWTDWAVWSESSLGAQIILLVLLCGGSFRFQKITNRSEEKAKDKQKGGRTIIYHTRGSALGRLALNYLCMCGAWVGGGGWGLGKRFFCRAVLIELSIMRIERLHVLWSTFEFRVKPS